MEKGLEEFVNKQSKDVMNELELKEIEKIDINELV